MIFFDTESIGFFGPTILIQYSKGLDEPIIIHNIFNEPIIDTLNLIESFMDDIIIGYNLVHDMFHLCRTYNVLKLINTRYLDPQDIYILEDTEEAHIKYCLKPKDALDLMLWGRQTIFQQTMNQKSIVLKKVPIALAVLLQNELSNIEINPLMFAKRKKEKEALWEIKKIHTHGGAEVTPEEEAKNKLGLIKLDIDQNFVNIRLNFAPSTALKDIMKYVLGKEETLQFSSFNLKRPSEVSWHPSNGAWLDYFPEYLFHWQNNQVALIYAKNDVQHLKDLYNYFKQPTPTKDSMLACMVGCLHWKGYKINLELCKTKFKEIDERLTFIQSIINVNAPQKVKKFLHEECDVIEKILINDTSEETLSNILLNPEIENIKLKERIKLVFEGRKLYGEWNLLKKLIIAKRLYITLKITGTKSDRMSGGSLNKSKSINPQGISRNSFIRELILFSDEGETLNGGDFDGFEISIADAHYQDPELRKLLLTEKSIHAIWGSLVYKKTYEEIMDTKKDASGEYIKAKTSFFAKLYCAYFNKLAEILKTNEESVREADRYFSETFKVITEKRKETVNKLTMISQPNGKGSEIIYKEPQEYIESFLGFKRFFTLEFKIIKELYKLSLNPPNEITNIGRSFNVKRSDRIQTGLGALQTSILSAAFQLQAHIQRAGINHEIQSPGARITKDLEYDIYQLQPQGIHSYYVSPLNVHDELMTPCMKGIEEELEEIVISYIKNHKVIVPFLKMSWKKNLKNWSEK